MEWWKSHLIILASSFVSMIIGIVISRSIENEKYWLFKKYLKKKRGKAKMSNKNKEYPCDECTERHNCPLIKYNKSVECPRKNP